MADNGLVRIGKLSSINYEQGTARITYEDKGGSTTAEFSFLAWEYWMPKIGEQVLVAHRSSGTSSAVILGPVWHDGRRPIEGAEGIYRKEYEAEQGVAYERYSAKEKKLTIVAGGCTITMQNGTVSITGNMAISGNLTVSGTIHSGGDMTAGSISAQGHTHSGVHGETSGPH